MIFFKRFGWYLMKLSLNFLNRMINRSLSRFNSFYFFENRAKSLVKLKSIPACSGTDVRLVILIIVALIFLVIHILGFLFNVILITLVNWRRLNNVSREGNVLRDIVRRNNGGWIIIALWPCRGRWVPKTSHFPIIILLRQYQPWTSCRYVWIL